MHRGVGVAQQGGTDVFESTEGGCLHAIGCLHQSQAMASNLIAVEVDFIHSLRAWNLVKRIPRGKAESSHRWSFAAPRCVRTLLAEVHGLAGQRNGVGKRILEHFGDLYFVFDTVSN